MTAIDTNVLIGAIQTFDPKLRASARRAVKSLYRAGEELLCFPQNLVEFWNASTRSEFERIGAFSRSSGAISASLSDNSPNSSGHTRDFPGVADAGTAISSLRN
jgi:predicted nucleic acid-binding protein